MASDERAEAADARARLMAVDPLRSVALEASAGTGKTRVLVDRYVRLVEAGVPPRHILAITFTRKAAAEMRQRVMATLETRRREGALAAERWREVREALPDISILTIDAFCLSLLQEFPLEAGVDPGFSLADETEAPRLARASLDRALLVGRALSLTDPDVALVLTVLGEGQLRAGLMGLVDRRLVAGRVLARVGRGREETIDQACVRLADSLRATLAALPGGCAALLAGGPEAPDFAWLARALDDLHRDPVTPARARAALDRLVAFSLTKAGTPRQRPAHAKARFRSAADYERHARLVRHLAPRIEATRARFRADLNLALGRGVARLFAVAMTEYRRTLDDLGALDFPELLDRTLGLLGRMEEFSRSRYRLESRYEHILVDEFQDTSRAQWRLVRELVGAWAAGEGLAHGPIPPSLFIVGDRKQSIYGFRDADVTVLDAAARFIDRLGPGGGARAAIVRSFRAVGELLAFVNDACAEIETRPDRPDAFRYGDDDRFPVPASAECEPEALHLVAADTDAEQAEAVAEAVARLLVERAVVRDRHTGVRRAIEPGDIGILFRTREGHALFEAALARRGVPFYVYKGLGFFDAPEVQDVLALMAYLASPGSDLRAAAWLRSRFVGLSDEALKHLAPNLAAAVVGAAAPGAATRLGAADAARLGMARRLAPAWIALADRVPPAELVDRAIAEAAYAVELAGPRLAQSRENLKKVRGMVRRLQNRGYATLGRLVSHFAELVAGGDESNAIIDAAGAVNLMTVHAAKGLEFPVVFIVNLHKGSGGRRGPIRVVAPPEGDDGDGLEGAGSVAVGEIVDEDDRDSEAKDREETKRLLYVALTRARDRLYLSATREHGQLRMTGGLGRFLPASLVAAWGGGGETADVVWDGRSTRHRLGRVAPAGAAVTAWRQATPPARRADDFDAVPASGAERKAVTEAVAAPGARAALQPGAGDLSARDPRASDAELGARVHRLLPWAASGASATGDPAWEVAARLVAASGLRDLVAAGRAVFEVPFSTRAPDGTVLRGRIDCLVLAPDSVTVIEFKTGAASPAHQAQLDAYVAAMAACHPGRRVTGRLERFALRRPGASHTIGGIKEPNSVAMTCPNCGNARNFLVKTLQMHVVQLDDSRVEVSEEGKPGVIEVLCDECDTAVNFEEVEDTIRKEVLLSLGAR